jgi:uncharacterized protein YecT (DUF1311 family)
MDFLRGCHSLKSETKMRLILLLVSVFFLCLFSNITVFADNNAPTPGLNSCLENSSDYIEYANCYSNAKDYWDKILNDNYKKAKNMCSKSEDEKDCLQLLLKTQRSWLAYRDGSITIFYKLMGPGHIADMHVSEFLYTVTKQQAQILGSFENLP